MDDDWTIPPTGCKTKRRWRVKEGEREREGRERAASLT